MESIYSSHWPRARAQLARVERAVAGRAVVRVEDLSATECSETDPCTHEGAPALTLWLDDGTRIELMKASSVDVGVIEAHYFPQRTTHFTHYAEGFGGCKACGSEAVTMRCQHCAQVFCGQECAAIGGKIKAEETLRYRDTNYIFGTRHDFTLARHGRWVTDGSGRTLFQAHPQSVRAVFALIDKSAFHKRTDEDAPRCCDIPYRVIEWGGHGDWVADMKDVPELSAALLALWQEQKQVHETTMRVRSSMPAAKK